MCNKLCTYRKWILDDGVTFNCTENPHIILGGKAAQQSGGAFSTITPSGGASTNLYSTTFHMPYLEIWNAYVGYIGGSGIVSATYIPQPAQLTQIGSYDAFNPLSGIPTTLPTQLIENYPNYIPQITLPIGSVFIGYAPPPWDFAKNIHSSEYVPAYNYPVGELNFSPSQLNLNYLLVEFLDVTGKYCQYA